MNIQATILADSINVAGIRLVTFHLRYPFALHHQFMTHRIFSRNGSSSRAIPVETLIDDVRNDPYIPEGLAANKAGMVPGDELDEETKMEILRLHEEHRKFSILTALRISKLGAHKQYANQYLNLHRHIDMVVSSTDWDNFLDQRMASDAREEIRVLAEIICSKLIDSDPRLLKDGEWHLPFILPEDRLVESVDRCVGRSAARCARTSYKKHDKSDATWDEDMTLYYRLIQMKHMSPLEHQAKADSRIRDLDIRRSGNFLLGWVQHRKQVERSLV